MPGYVLPAVSKTRLPRTSNEARFHAEYCIALAACGADVILPEHSLDLGRHLDRPEVRTMLANIELAGDQELTHYHQCRLEFQEPGGGVRGIRSNAPKGSPQIPMSDAEVVAKFQRLAGRQLSAAASASYAAKFAELERMPDCRWIFDDLTGPSAQPRAPKRVPSGPDRGRDPVPRRSGPFDRDEIGDRGVAAQRACRGVFRRAVVALGEVLDEPRTR